jgi:arginine exporter protein ArgO
MMDFLLRGFVLGISIAGVFVGSAVWWLLLSFSASRFRQAIKPGFMVSINYASAVIICGLGLWCLSKH